VSTNEHGAPAPSALGARRPVRTTSVLGRLVQAYAATVRAGQSGGHFYLRNGQDDRGVPWDTPDPLEGLRENDPQEKA